MIKSLQKTLLSIIITFISLSSFSIEPPNNLVVQILENGIEQDEETKVMDLITVNYTGWIFEGPNLVPEILDGLTLQMEKHGFRNIKEVIGSEEPWK